MDHHLPAVQEVTRNRVVHVGGRRHHRVDGVGDRLDPDVSIHAG